MYFKIYGYISMNMKNFCVYLIATNISIPLWKCIWETSLPTVMKLQQAWKSNTCSWLQSRVIIQLFWEVPEVNTRAYLYWHDLELLVQRLTLKVLFKNGPKKWFNFADIWSGDSSWGYWEIHWNSLKSLGHLLRAKEISKEDWRDVLCI